MPFALNEATRFISPTKTPEYLAAGRPVVSTPVVDVVRQYGRVAAVEIGAGPEAFVGAVERALALGKRPETWRAEADELLARSSWDDTWQRMDGLLRHHAPAILMTSETTGARIRPSGRSRA